MSDNTKDLGSFGLREKDIAIKLLDALMRGKWNSDSDELETGISIEFNPNSGSVFLIDNDYNVAMLNDKNKLENFLTCLNCGDEGLRSEVKFINNNTCKSCNDK